MTPDTPTETGLGPADPAADQAPDRSKAPATKKATKKAPTKKRGPGRPKAGATLGKEAGEALADVCSLAYLGALASGQDRLAYDLNILVTNAEGIGKALGKLCEKSPAAYRAVELLLTSSAYGELLGVLLGVAVPIAVNHGLIPLQFWDTLPGTSGVEPPDPRPPKPEPEEPEPFHPDDPEAEARASAAFASLRAADAAG